MAEHEGYPNSAGPAAWNPTLSGVVTPSAVGFGEFDPSSVAGMQAARVATLEQAWNGSFYDVDQYNAIYSSGNPRASLLLVLNEPLDLGFWFFLDMVLFNEEPPPTAYQGNLLLYDPSGNRIDGTIGQDIFPVSSELNVLDGDEYPIILGGDRKIHRMVWYSTGGTFPVTDMPTIGAILITSEWEHGLPLQVHGVYGEGFPDAGPGPFVPFWTGFNRTQERR